MASEPSRSASTAFRDGYDEAWSAPEVPRPEYEDVLRTLALYHRPALRSRIRLHLSRGKVTFGSGPDATPFVVDPVPRVINAEEWERLSSGLAQRVRALEAFVQDAYADRRIVAAGIVRAATIDEAEGFEPELRGRLPGGAPAIGVAGLDVVRDRDGAFLVLEDNLRTPSGFAYAAAARGVLERELLPIASRRPFADEAFTALAETFAAAAPDGGDPSTTAVLTDGIASSALYEHDQVAQRLGLALVKLADLELHDGRLVRRGRRGRRHPVDVLYRRCNEDRMREDDGRPTAVAALLAGPWLDGRLGIVNAFGTGVADDKAVHAYVEEMIRFYLREEPLLRSVRTLDLANAEHRRRALKDIDQFVIKPRHGQGGAGIVVCAHATDADVTEIVEAIKRQPEKYVAQRTIALSRHPTMMDDGALAPRHIDLRPFAFATRDAITIPAGGLTRVALGDGALVVNSSQDGGGKDTWVMA
jgi:carboxylate-amine ligase